MSLLQRIKSEQLQARKAKDYIIISVLTTLIGDAEMVGKNNGNRESTDSEVLATIKKFIINNKETLNILFDQKHDVPADQILKLRKELDILTSFLPPQLSADSLTEVIDQLITTLQAANIKDMGKVMKNLKEKYDGQYDGTIASNLIKQKLGG